MKTGRVTYWRRHAYPLAVSLAFCLSQFVFVGVGRCEETKLNTVDDEAHETGFVPDAPEALNKAAHAPRYRAFLPTAVDLSSKMPPPGDQGRLGSCTSWATAYAARSYYTYTRENRLLSSQANIPSPLYVWQLSHSGGCSGGSSFSNAIDVLSKGALSTGVYPYSNFCSKPSSTQIASAHDFFVRAPVIIDGDNLDDIRGVLAHGDPVLFAIEWGKGWACGEGAKCVKDGYLLEGNGSYRKHRERHAMVFIGYDDRRQALRVMNSWGRKWGDHGYAWMSYDFVRHHRIDEAMYLLVDATKPPPAPIPTPVPPIPKPIPSPTPKPTPFNIEGLTCSKINHENVQGRERLTGFVQSAEDLARIKGIIDPSKTDLRIHILPFPLCEAALTLEKPLAEPDRPDIDTGGREKFKGGDTLAFKVQSTQSLRYLYILYFSRDGDVQVLAQPHGIVPSPSPPRGVHTFGDGLEGRQKFTVEGPFGTEMILALAAKSPLFDQPLPSTQTEREFLTQLRRQLIYKPDPSLPDREVSASMTELTTEPGR